MSGEMASGNMPECDRLESERFEREQRWFKKNANIGRPKEVLLKELDTRRLLTRSIPVPSQQYPLDLLQSL